jgi:hypothetical protein
MWDLCDDCKVGPGQDLPYFNGTNEKEVRLQSVQFLCPHGHLYTLFLGGFLHNSMY